MKRMNSPITLCVVAGLISCIGAKLLLTGLSFYFNDGTHQRSFFQEGTALAKDEKDEGQKSKKNKKAPKDEPVADKDVPEITDIKRQIGSLEGQLKKISESLDTYSKSLPGKTSLSPETLENKRLQIEKERLALDEDQKRLAALKTEIDEKIVTLRKIQNAVRKDLEQKQAVQDNRIKHLIKVYTTMPPKKAAALIEKLEMDVVMALFSKMKGENVGQILPYVSPEKAAKISAQLAKRHL